MTPTSRGLLRSHPLLAYSLLRVVLLLVVTLLLYVVGARGLLLLVLAIVVSGLASLPLLRGQRDAVAAAVLERSRRARTRLDEAAASEDED